MSGKENVSVPQRNYTHFKNVTCTHLLAMRRLERSLSKETPIPPWESVRFCFIASAGPMLIVFRIERKEDSQLELPTPFRNPNCRKRPFLESFWHEKKREGPCSTSLKFADDRALVYRENEVKLLARGRSVRTYTLWIENRISKLENLNIWKENIEFHSNRIPYLLHKNNSVWRIYYLSQYGYIVTFYRQL